MNVEAVLFLLIFLVGCKSECHCRRCHCRDCHCKKSDYPRYAVSGDVSLAPNFFDAGGLFYDQNDNGPGNVRELMPSNINDVLNNTVQNGNEVAVVEFYANWCPYCKEHTEVYKSQAKSLTKFNNVRLYAFECTLDSERRGICMDYGIESFPEEYIIWKYRFEADQSVKDLKTREFSGIRAGVYGVAHRGKLLKYLNEVGPMKGKIYTSFWQRFNPWRKSVSLMAISQPRWRPEQYNSTFDVIFHDAVKGMFNMLKEFSKNLREGNIANMVQLLDALMYCFKPLHHTDLKEFRDYFAKVTKTGDQNRLIMNRHEYLNMIQKLRIFGVNADTDDMLICRESTCAVWYLYHLISMSVSTQYTKYGSPADHINFHYFNPSKVVALDLQTMKENERDFAINLWKVHNMATVGEAIAETARSGIYLNQDVRFPPVEACEACRIGSPYIITNEIVEKYKTKRVLSKEDINKLEDFSEEETYKYLEKMYKEGRLYSLSYRVNWNNERKRLEFYYERNTVIA